VSALSDDEAGAEFTEATPPALEVLRARAQELGLTTADFGPQDTVTVGSLIGMICAVTERGFPDEDTIASRVERAQARVDSLSTFAGVSTFLAGFATADLAGFEYDGWEEHWAVVYVTMMSFTVGCGFFCSVVSIMIVFTIQSYELHDNELMHRAKNASLPLRIIVEENGTYAMFIRECKVTDAATEPKFPMAFFFMMSTGDFAQWTWKPPFVQGNALCVGMLIFPYAVVFYMAAVALKVLVAAKFSSSVAIGLSAPMILWAVPMVKLARSALRQGLW
jgi:hypothetical protein